MRGAWILGWAMLVGCGGSGGTVDVASAPADPSGDASAGIGAPAAPGSAPAAPGEVAAVPPILIGQIAVEPDLVPPGVAPPELVPPVVAPSVVPPQVSAPADRGAGPELLVVVSTEPAGASCANGGVRAEAGIDADQDGALLAGELEQTRLLCDGATPLAHLLLRTTDPAPTAACPGGVTTAQLGEDADGDEDLADQEVSIAFQACAPVIPTVAHLALGPPTGRSLHLTAIGELYSACADAPGSLCRHHPAITGPRALAADLDGDGATDLRAVGGGEQVVPYAGASGGAVIAIASDADGNVYFSSEADAVVRKYLRGWDATVEWQVGCDGARLAADDLALYASCGDGSLQAWRLVDGAPLPLAVTGAPAVPVRQLAVLGGWMYIATDGEIGRFPSTGGGYERLVGGAVGAMAVGADGTVWFTERATLRTRSPGGALATSSIPASDPRDLTLRGNLLAVRAGSGLVTLVDLASY